jgi:hypothetical protein
MIRFPKTSRMTFALVAGGRRARNRRYPQGPSDKPIPLCTRPPRRYRSAQSRARRSRLDKQRRLAPGPADHVMLTGVMYIRITATPPGEAPLEVRAGWIGLVLPVVPGRQPGRFLTSGVVTGPRSFFATLRHLLLGRFARVDGYPVDAATAVAILAKHHPTAADWWTATPHRLRPGGTFIFHSHVCEPLAHSED